MYQCELPVSVVDWSWTSLVNNRDMYCSDHLESVLQNLKDQNTPEGCWSDYIQEWIENVCIKQDNTFTQGISEGVEKILDQYWRVKNQECYADILEKIDVLILCGILEICCCFCVNETSLVNKVLLCTYESNPMVFNSYFDLTSRNSTECYNVIKRERLSYFLWHANQAHSLFGEQRLTERILCSLSEENVNFLADPLRIKPDSNTLMTILSYGTFDLISSSEDYTKKPLCTFPVFNMLRDILTDMYFCCYSRNGAIPSCILARQPQFKDSVTSLQLLIRSIVRIPKEFVDNTEFWPDTRWGKYNFAMILQHFVLCDQLPEFKYRLSQPAKLKHICRISIRKRLYQNFELPNGVQKLGLPESLSGYIDLKSD